MLYILYSLYSCSIHFYSIYYIIFSYIPYLIFFVFYIVSRIVDDFIKLFSFKKIILIVQFSALSFKFILKFILDTN